MKKIIIAGFLETQTRLSLSATLIIVSGWIASECQKVEMIP